MKKLLPLALCLCLCAFASISAWAQSRPYCDLKGAVCVVPHPNQADYRIYLEKSEAFADIPVYKAPNLLFADKSGLWFFTETRAQATFTIAWVQERALADFTVYITENEAFAGCK